MLVLCITVCGCAGANLMLKIRLFVKVRSDSRSRIESVPVKQLVELAGCCERRWSFVDGWLILEGSE